MQRHPQPEIFLIDGALTQQSRSRSEVIALMSADLVRLDAFATEADAIRALMWAGLYSTFEVMVLVDHARHEAQQIVVAREMSRS